jgi:hypothetical protein
MTRLEELQELTREGYRTLQRRFPSQFTLGGCLFLGKQFAHPASRTVMLGINPGVGQWTGLDVGLQAHDYLLEGPDSARHRYLTGARICFKVSPQVREALRLATFSFCCPYRTASWSDLAPDLRSALLDASRPVLWRLMGDCQPALVIVAGVDGFRAFEQTLGRTLQVQRALSRGGSGGAYQWEARAATCDGCQVTVAQVPHFSRANSRPRLEECGRWLGEIVQSTPRA